MIHRPADRSPDSSGNQDERPRRAIILTLCLMIPAMTAFLLAKPGFAKDTSSYALTGGTIVTGAGGVIEDGTLLIRDGIIEKIGTGLSIPHDAKAIDCKGMTLYPGFIDAATSLGMPDGKALSEIIPARDDRAQVVTETVLARTRENNRKGVRPWFRAADWVALKEDGGKDHRAAGITTVVTAPRGQSIAGVSAVLNLSGKEPRMALLKTNAAQHATLRSSGEGYPQTTMGVMAHLRQLFLDTQHYVSSWRCYNEGNSSMRRPPLDQTLEAMKSVLGGFPLVFDASRENSMHRVLRLADEFNLNVIINGGEDAHRMIDDLAERNTPVFLELDFPEKPRTRADRKAEKEAKEAKKEETSEEKKDDEAKASTDDEAEKTERPGGRRGGRRNRDPKVTGSNLDAGKKEEEKKEDDDEKLEPERVLEQKKSDWEKRASCAARLHEAGVPFAFTTRDLSSPKDLLKNVRTAMEYGLPEDAALSALSLKAAQILGIDEVVGTLEKGKIANIVVMTAPLREEKSKVNMVFVDGHQFEITASKSKGGNPSSDLNVSGEWAVVTEGPTGTLESTLTLVQDGGSLSGSLKSQMGTASISDGGIDGRDITLVVTFEMGGNEIEIDIEATVSEDGNKLTGKLKTPFGPEASFSGTRSNPSRKNESNWTDYDDEEEFSCCEEDGR